MSENTAVDPQLLDRQLRAFLAAAPVLPLQMVVTAHEPEAGWNGGLPIIWSNAISNPEEDPDHHEEFGVLVGPRTLAEAFTPAVAELLVAAANALPALLADREAITRKGIDLQARVEFLEKVADEACSLLGEPEEWGAWQRFPQQLLKREGLVLTKNVPKLLIFIKGKRAVADSKETEE